MENRKLPRPPSPHVVARFGPGCRPSSPEGEEKRSAPQWQGRTLSTGIRKKKTKDEKKEEAIKVVTTLTPKSRIRAANRAVLLLTSN